MTPKEARDYILERSTSFLQRDKSGKGYLCPICGSGSGKKGTGITTKDNIHFTCWSGCYSNSDLIDIIGCYKNHVPMDDFMGKLRETAREFNIPLEETEGSKVEKAPGKEKSPSPSSSAPKKKEPDPETDYSDFFLQAEKNLDQTDYYRGISLETLKKYHVGFVKSWSHPKDGKHFSPRLIIPTSKTSYLARDTRKEIPAEEEDYIKQKVGKIHIFNAGALQTAPEPIFLVEGELDCLSLLDLGRSAVALGSISYRGIFLNLVKDQKPSQPIIIALDQEKDPEKRERVEEAIRDIKKGLEELGISHYTATNLSGEYKDPNEALQADRESLEKRSREILAEVSRRESAKEEAEREELKREAVSNTLPYFFTDIEARGRAEVYSTGFPDMDQILDGGLHAGLYCLGAITSLGKTTFILEIADTIARSGQDVLFFSLEMAKEELIAKSFSRISYILSMEKYGVKSYGKTTRRILGTPFGEYCKEEKEILLEAYDKYWGIADHLYISEGVGSIGVAEIREKVERHTRLTGKAPVIFVDYLQILAPAEVRATDKQNTDKAVLELKRLSRDFGIPVIAVSSFNRENYNAPVNLSSFKESGAVEYSSDVLIGLQYLGMDYQEGENEKKRAFRIASLRARMEKLGRAGSAQPVQVKILKNRNGSRGSFNLDFYPMFNYYTGESSFIQPEDSSSSSAPDWVEDLEGASDGDIEDLGDYGSSSSPEEESPSGSSPDPDQENLEGWEKLT